MPAHIRAALCLQFPTVPFAAQAPPVTRAYSYLRYPEDKHRILAINIHIHTDTVLLTDGCWVLVFGEFSLNASGTSADVDVEAGHFSVLEDPDVREWHILSATGPLLDYFSRGDERYVALRVSSGPSDAAWVAGYVLRSFTKLGSGLINRRRTLARKVPRITQVKPEDQCALQIIGVFHGLVTGTSDEYPVLMVQGITTNTFLGGRKLSSARMSYASVSSSLRAAFVDHISLLPIGARGSSTQGDGESITSNGTLLSKAPGK